MKKFFSLLLAFILFLSSCSFYNDYDLEIDESKLSFIGFIQSSSDNCKHSNLIYKYIDSSSHIAVCSNDGCNFAGNSGEHFIQKSAVVECVDGQIYHCLVHNCLLCNISVEKQFIICKNNSPECMGEICLEQEEN